MNDEYYDELQRLEKEVEDLRIKYNNAQVELSQHERRCSEVYDSKGCHVYIDGKEVKK